jgi:hypothetical protein
MPYNSLWLSRGILQKIYIKYHTDASWAVKVALYHSTQYDRVQLAYEVCSTQTKNHARRLMFSQSEFWEQSSWTSALKVHDKVAWMLYSKCTILNPDEMTQNRVWRRLLWTHPCPEKIIPGSANAPGTPMGPLLRFSAPVAPSSNSPKPTSIYCKVKNKQTNTLHSWASPPTSKI